MPVKDAYIFIFGKLRQSAHFETPISSFRGSKMLYIETLKCHNLMITGLYEVSCNIIPQVSKYWTLDLKLILLLWEWMVFDDRKHIVCMGVVVFCFDLYSGL